jgi:hypothetical protein
MSNEHDEPLTWCERCRYWLPWGCEQDNDHWPDFGDQCNQFEREPGVEA